MLPYQDKKMRTDRDILRELVSQYAEFAYSAKNAEKLRLHRAVNDLSMIRPIVLIDEIPRHEMELEQELTLQCSDPDFRALEEELRHTLYQLRHMPADLAVPTSINVMKVIHNSGIGIEVSEETLGAEGEINSHRYHNMLEDQDLSLLHNPVITYDEEESLRKWDKIGRAVGDIMPVRLTGEATGYGLGCKTWDTISTLMGVDNLLYGLIDEPDFMHALVEKLTDIFCSTIEQYASLNLIDTDALYCHSASAATSGMPKEAADYEHVNLKKVWGRGIAQIFSTVSPEMHDEFDIQYMKRALAPFGYVYYGCCEPLDQKIDILRQIPNLRKISITPWADIRNAARQIRKDYVISSKPNPAQLSLGVLNRPAVTSELSNILDACRENGCSVELVLKDISTVGGNPQCLFEWEKLAMELVENY